MIYNFAVLFDIRYFIVDNKAFIEIALGGKLQHFLGSAVAFQYS